jgi:hypothetical protein
MNTQPQDLFELVRPRFITTNTTTEFFDTFSKLKAEGHFIPTITRGTLNGQWTIEVIYKDE